ncbi:PLP-dependent cysteine synthase family protein [Arenimonas alkanexedens]
MNSAPGRRWLHAALAELAQESADAVDTHLLRIDLPEFPDIRFYFKDEAAHATGSLKHRLARSLYLYALCNGRLNEGQGAIDASSGSTAISEAWFARLLGLRFIAVMPGCTAPGKVRLIRSLGADCVLVPHGVDASLIAQERAEREGLCYLDQFGLAERATDWRGNNNIAESILDQMAANQDPAPTWIVCGAGTGGTSATVGRYLRYRRLDTRVCVAEPSGGAFATGWHSRDSKATARMPTKIEGIGRPRVEPGFLFDVVDRVEEIDDAESIAAAWRLESLIGQRYGGSSGTNLVACLRLARELRAAGEAGSIVSLLCDRGDRYDETLFDRRWLADHGIDLDAGLARITALEAR